MLRVAVVVLLIGSIFAAVYSSMTVIAPKRMLESTFKIVAGKATDDVEDAGYMKVLLGRQRRMGTYALVTVIFSFFVLLSGFRRGEKWAWWCFLIGGGIAWLSGLIDYISIGSVMHIILQSIGMLIFLIGILIPVKAFFGKAAEEAPPEAQ